MLKVAPLTVFTVRLVPSIQIEPFWAMYFASASGARKSMRMLPPSGRRSSSSPTPSTWPLTMCPPRRLTGVNAFSRFTRLPLPRLCSVVSCMVSLETSASNIWWVRRVTVRQTPLTAMLSPSTTSLKSSALLCTLRRHSPPRNCRESTVPSASMMPVNMLRSLCQRLMMRAVMRQSPAMPATSTISSPM